MNRRYNKKFSYCYTGKKRSKNSRFFINYSRDKIKIIFPSRSVFVCLCVHTKQTTNLRTLFFLSFILPFFFFGFLFYFSRLFSPLLCIYVFPIKFYIFSRVLYFYFPSHQFIFSISFVVQLVVFSIPHRLRRRHTTSSYVVQFIYYYTVVVVVLLC